MELHITFGWHLDGPSYPESTAVGELAVGPIGMLSQLCLRLGLTARFPAQSVRIAEFMSRLRAHDDGAQFYSPSFKTDSWGTAKALLFLRDSLISSGWNPDDSSVQYSTAPERLKSLAALSRVGASLPGSSNSRATDIVMANENALSRDTAKSNLLCLSDMINPIFERLDQVDRIAIDRITLIDEEALLPPVWQRLLTKLRSKNVLVQPWGGKVKSRGGEPFKGDRNDQSRKDRNSDSKILSDSDVAEVARMFRGQTLANYDGIDSEKKVERETDIDRLRSFLQTNKPAKFTGDGTIVILESDDEVQAADYLSSLLATMTGGAEDTVLIRGSSTSFLDQLLTRLNLPALGGADKSPHRGYMQTLPLAFEILWKPFDPQKMIEFLMLPKGPVGRKIASFFIRALQAQPGIGSGAWERAWLESEAQFEKWAKRDLERARIQETAVSDDFIAADQAAVKTRVMEQLATLRGWLEPVQLFEAHEGIPVSVVLDVCERIRRHANIRANTLVDSMTDIQLQVFLITAMYAETLAATVTASQSETITRSQLLRMIESSMGDGYAPDSPHASVWTPVDHPGQIIDSADTVIWWGFVNFENHGFSNPWSNEEIEFLASHGVLLDSPQSSVLREASSWSRPLDASAKRLMLVKPRTVAGRTAAAHPFFHEIAAAIEATPHSIRAKFIKQAHQVYSQIENEVLGKLIVSQAVELKVPPNPRHIWRIKPRKLIARTESATSLERLLGCPMSWMFKYQANLKFGSLLSITGGEQLSGILAHAVLGGIFSDQNWPTLEHVEQRSYQLFDELCPKIAAPLLLPGSSLDRQRLKKAIGEAAVSLLALIRQAGFSSVVSESAKDATIDDLPLTGRIDLVLKHPDNHDYVIDLKWTRRSSYRRRELSEGRAIQLALYTSMLKRETGIRTSGGYYMISQRQLFSTSSEPFPLHTFVDGPKLEHTFASLLTNTKQHLEHLQSGTVYATGLTSNNEPVEIVIDESGVDIIIDDDPEERPSRVPNITLALEPPCKVCDFGRLCGKKGFDR